MLFFICMLEPFPLLLTLALIGVLLLLVVFELSEIFLLGREVVVEVGFFGSIFVGKVVLGFCYCCNDYSTKNINSVEVIKTINNLLNFFIFIII